jgi:hypothetical protein
MLVRFIQSLSSLAFELTASFPLDKSTLELGMEALARMPREQAIEGAIAFQGLSYVLMLSLLGLEALAFPN